MSNYFLHTKSIEYAVQVLSLHTQFIGGVRFSEVPVASGWTHEWHISTMREELKLNPEDPISERVARDYIYSKLSRKSLPKFIQQMMKDKEELDKKRTEFDRVLSNLWKPSGPERYTKKRLIKFAEKFFPEIELDPNMKKQEVVDKLKYV